MRFSLRCTLLCAGVLAMAAVGQASPLNLGAAGLPNIAADSITVTYDPSTGAFIGSGYALNLTQADTPALGIDDGTFLVQLLLSSAGVPSGGLLQIEGSIPSLGTASGLLLTGNLTDFGFPEAGDEVFEFIFDVTGGDLADLGVMTGQIDVVLIAIDSGFSGDFADYTATGFANGGHGMAIAFLPEPATLALLGAGATLTFLRRRKR